MTTNLFLGSLVMLSVAATIIDFLTTTRVNNRSTGRSPSVRTGKNSGEREEAE